MGRTWVEGSLVGVEGNAGYGRRPTEVDKKELFGVCYLDLILTALMIVCLFVQNILLFFYSRMVSAQDRKDVP